MSLTFTMDDVREHCSPPTNGWLLGADSIKMADEIDNLRREVDHLQREAAENAAKLAELRTNSNAWRNDALKAEAAIARVRELCEGWPSWREVTAAEVLRALDGGE